MIDDPDARALLTELAALIGSIRTDVEKLAQRRVDDRALVATLDPIGLAADRAAQLTQKLLGAPATDVPMPSAQTTPASTQGNEPVVLLVEDERLVSQSIARLLDQLGYTVIVAESPGEALGHCRETDATIDLLLTDYTMPGMNGMELATRVRALRPQCRVVVMSGYSPGGEAAAGVLFLAKPFTVETLTTAVRAALAP